MAALSEEFAISRGTARRVLITLRDEGLITITPAGEASSPTGRTDRGTFAYGAGSKGATFAGSSAGRIARACCVS